jgi:type IV pilus assembly protein PilX
MVLVTSLVILLVITMLALSAVQSTSIQELISRNQRDSNLAFNAAETALVEAESIINSLSSLSYGDSVSPKIYDARSSGALTNLWNSTYVNASSSNVDVVASQPVFVIEHVRTVISDEDRLNIDNIGQNPNTCCTQMFRITARGTGGTDNAKVVLQTTYGKRF